MKYCLMMLAITLLAVSCSPDPQDDVQGNDLLDKLLRERAPDGSLSYFQVPQRGQYSKIPQDPNNPITQIKVELGKFLFHETALGMAPKVSGAAQTYSCASCHHAEAGFQSGMRQGIGDGGLGFGVRGESRFANPNYADAELDVQPLKTPSAMNVAYQPNQLWNGQFGNTELNRPFSAKWKSGTPLEANHMGFEGTEIQAIAGQGVHRLMVNEEIVTQNGYKELFDDAYSHVPVAERYTPLNAALAIAAYERTLLPQQAPFQEWLAGDRSMMTPEELEGAILFFDKARCYQCHSGPALNSMQFYALGMGNLSGQSIFNTPADHAAHLGRGGFTERYSDMHKFKVPQLYNLKDAHFLGHGATIEGVRSMIEYKNAGIPEKDIPEDLLAEEFKPLNLTESEIDALTAFVENALYDPHLDRYVPSSLPSGKCFPNNDYLSKLDMNCN